MEDVFDETWRGSAESGGASVETELASLIDIYGLSSIDRPDRIAQQLSQACPDAPRHVDAVVAALRAGVPDRLRGAKDDDTLPALLQRIVRDLQADTAIDEGWAGWAVRAWAHAFALPTTGAGHDPAATSDVAVDVAVDAALHGGDTRPWDVAAPVATVRSDTGVESDALRRAAPPPVSAAFDFPTTVFAADAMLRTETRDARPGGDGGGRARARSADRREPVLRPPARAAADEPPAGGDDAVAPAELIAPLFAADEAARVAIAPVGPIGLVATDLRMPPATAIASERDVPPPGFAAPGVGDAAGPPLERPSRRRVAPIVLGGSVLAIVAVATFAWFSQRGPTDRAATTARTARAAPQVAATAPRTAEPTTAGPPVTTDVASRAAPSPAPSAPQTPTTGTPSPLIFTPSAPQDATAPTAAPLPASATAQAPAAEHVPVIARVDVPRVVEGAPFAVTLRLASDARDVASVERRIVDGRGTWPRNGVVSEASGLRAIGSGALVVPFRAMDAPADATVQFTAIARDGTRSAPKLATVAVTGPTPWTSQRRNADGIGREPAVPCGIASCGTVVEARELVPEFDARTPVYQVVVRMDDRQTLAVTASYRLQTGSRVRLVDGRIVPAVDRAP